MKKFIEVTASVKSLGAIFFAGLIIVYTVFGGFFGLREISFPLVWQALFIALIASMLHFLAFTDAVLKKAGYLHRCILFSIPLFIALSGFAYFGKWFPANNVINWFIFAALYLFFFGAVLIAFSLYFRITGRRYTEMLNIYKQRL